MRRQLVQRLRARTDREGAERADGENAMLDDPGWPLPVRGRDPARGQIDHAADVPVRREAVQLLVVGFSNMERSSHGYRAIPGAVQREAVGIRVATGWVCTQSLRSATGVMEASACTRMSVLAVRARTREAPGAAPRGASR